MKTKIFLIGFVFLIAMGCEKEKIYDYNLYTGFWQTIHDSTTYIMLIQSIDPLLISYNVDGKEWDCVSSYKDFGRLYASYANETLMGIEYCDIELICLKYNKMAGLVMMVPSTIPTNLYEISLVFEKQ